MAETGDEEVAETVLRTALSKTPEAVLRVTLGRVLIRQNRHKEAMTEMVGVLRHEPDNAMALAVLANCLLECGELERGRKMLSKARSAGAPHQEVEALENRYHELLERSTNPKFALREASEGAEGPAGASLTNPDHVAPEQVRKRQHTLMGRPNPELDVGDPRRRKTGSNPVPPAVPAASRRLPPPPLQSGTFAGLDTYDIDGDPDDALDATSASERVRLSEQGPLERIADRELPPRPNGQPSDFAAPDEMTFAGALDDVAAPDEATAHIVLDEADLATQSENSLNTVESSWERLPSVQYDPAYAAEARNLAPHSPPSDLDELPSWDSALPKFDGPHIETDPTAPDFPPTREERVGELTRRSGMHSGRGLPSLDPSVLFDDDSLPPQGGAALDIPVKPEYRLSDPEPFANPAHFDSAPQPRPRQPSHPRPQQHPSHPPQPRQYEPSGPQWHEQAQPRAVRHAEPSGPARRPSQPSMQPFDLEPNSVPVDQRWTGGGQQAPPARREVTAVAAEPRRRSGASGSLKILVEKRWPIVGMIFLAVLFAGFLGLSIASGVSLNSTLESSLNNATELRANDTFEGYLQAEQKLLEAANVASFMGSGFDSFVESYLPIPGLGASKLRRVAISELAAVSAILEYRFENLGKHKASSRLEAARDRAPNQAMTAVAAAFAALTENRPHEALEILDQAKTEHDGDFRIEEARAWALLALDRPSEAAKIVQPLRAAQQLSIQQKFLVASVDAARGDESASKAFADVFAESPDHVDARIARSYTLRKDAEDLKKAQNVLDTVLVKLQRKASRFQKARATSAYGSIYLAAGEAQRAEDRFRDAISKMPDRSELYLPLLEFYASHGRPEEVEKYLSKARAEKAYSPRVAMFEARLRLLESEPEKSLAILDSLAFEDAQKAFVRGLALIDDHKVAQAASELEKAKEGPGDTLEVTALYHLARAVSKAEALEDSVYQLDRLKAKNADSATIFWAAALAAKASSDATSTRKKRDERLASARQDLERAIELEPGFARAHFDLCEVLVRELQTEKAERSCVKGRALAPKYVPGIVATARLRLAQGKYGEAEKLAKEATAARPDDPVVGLLTARIAIEQRRLADAQKELNRWLAKPADKFELNLLEGRLEFARKSYTRAAGYLKEAYEMRPADGEAAVYYAHTLTRLDQEKPAAEVLLDNLSHPAWGGYAWAVLGEARRMQNRLKDAFENFSKASKLYAAQDMAPKYWSHLYAEWALAMKQRYRKWRHPKVVDKLKTGRKKGDSDDPEINLMWSRYHLEKRRPDYDQAIRYLERVVEAAPYHCEAVDVLRELYVREDRKDAVATLDESRDPLCGPAKAAEEPKKSRRRRR